jgi:prepilin-type processing-associated H-X9-DG protein
MVRIAVDATIVFLDGHVTFLLHNISGSLKEKAK